ncbi:MAG: diheme cytochrome c [Candidatus Polarisedimenticolaceae bacterium]|nr:diheme cytochrome c [Candidatus Polarisedimenticolaceae bacterium]
MKHILLTASTIMLTTAMLGISSVALSDDDNNRGQADHRYNDQPGYSDRQYDQTYRRAQQKRPGVAPVNNPQYVEECGSCHFAYQPGLLPARSWAKLMTGLDDHFGENAELPTEDGNLLLDYLLNNAADHSNFKRSVKIMKSLHPSEAPLRVSQTPYFLKKHDELTPNRVQDNPKVGSLSRCEACHTEANRGSFSESEILIPNFGPWEESEKEEKRSKYRQR